MNQLGKIIVIIVLIALNPFAMAADETQSVEKLNKISQMIERLRQGISQDRNKQSNLFQEIKESQSSVDNNLQKLSDLKTNIDKQNIILNQLRQKQTQQENQLKEQQATFSRQLLSAYLLSHHQYLDILLSQHDPHDVDRYLAYYKYIHRARLALIQKIDFTVKEISNNQREIVEHLDTLNSLLNAQKEEQVKLLASYNQNKRKLAALNTKIKSNNQQLTELIANKQALEKVVKDLQFQNPFTALFSGSHSQFAALKGKLPWPTPGKIVRPFNTFIAQSDLKSTGVLIAASNGQAVRAIYPGRVAFAHWLQGFGLLIILDHGQGFMTLYGQNQFLYKRVGEKVEAGEVISLVGNAAARDFNGLYFEIRRSGSAENPAKWCRKV